MKPLLKKLIRISIIIIGAAAFTLLGFYSSKIRLDRWKAKPLVEQIPFDEVLEVLGFEEAEFYTSANEFMRAEIRINVRFAARIEPADRLPSEYRRGDKKAYSTVEIHVLEIPSLEMLGKMKDALSQRNHLKLDKDKDVQATFKESQIGKKRVKRIEKILVKPESYYFVQY